MYLIHGELLDSILQIRNFKIKKRCPLKLIYIWINRFYKIGFLFLSTVMVNCRARHSCVRLSEIVLLLPWNSAGCLKLILNRQSSKWAYFLVLHNPPFFCYSWSFIASYYRYFFWGIKLKIIIKNSIFILSFVANSLHNF